MFIDFAFDLGANNIVVTAYTDKAKQYIGTDKLTLSNKDGRELIQKIRNDKVRSDIDTFEALGYSTEEIEADLA